MSHCKLNRVNLSKNSFSFKRPKTLERGQITQAIQWIHTSHPAVFRVVKYYQARQSSVSNYIVSSAVRHLNSILVPRAFSLPLPPSEKGLGTRMPKFTSSNRSQRQFNKFRDLKSTKSAQRSLSFSLKFLFFFFFFLFLSSPSPSSLLLLLLLLIVDVHAVFCGCFLFVAVVRFCR